MGRNMRQQRRVVLSCALLWLQFATASALAQSNTGNISGAVVDSSDAVIPGATVTLINERTDDVRTLITNEEGRFIFSAIQPDSYTLKVELESFQTLEQKNIVLSASQNLTLGRLTIHPGQLSETLTITASGDRPEAESSDLTGRL